MTEERLIGKVNWFDPAKGYGFIDHEGNDVFTHWSFIKLDGFKTLAKGQLVEYTLKSVDGKLQAHDVMPKE